MTGRTGHVIHQRAGMTLIEVMFATGILTIVLGTLFGMTFAFSNTIQVQDATVTAHDEARRALLRIVPDLRQAASSTINWDELPGETISYSVAMDVDGNGTAVDDNGRLEVGGTRTIGRDVEDANGDGLTMEQLIVTRGDTTTVLANGLSPDSEQPAADGTFGAAEDTNGNGRIDRGVWFEPWNGGIRVNVQAQSADRQGHLIRYTLQEIVYPRN